jgi:glycerol-3-phosphate acyltransferase PlsX
VATGRIGYMMLRPALRSFKRKTDYSEYGGAPLLGINGTCIISHGRSSARAIKNAIRIAAEMSHNKVNELISADLGEVHGKG